MKQTFYSNGKLLITGEYVVLDGAKALAVPTKFGQDLVVEPSHEKGIRWTSYDSDGSIWFEGSFSVAEITSDAYLQRTNSVRSTLLEILHETHVANPAHYGDDDGWTIKTHLTFPKLWGLGTSSTLISNIAQWAQIDPYQLPRNSFGGSGYDIACARAEGPIMYRLEEHKPVVEKADFNPAFAEDLYFVYLNRKQSSKAAIRSYRNNHMEDQKAIIAELDAITSHLPQAKTIADFGRLIENHESIMSQVLEMRTVREAFFSDFPGSIKSLGGWGGDFVLAVAEKDPTAYFNARGFTTVIPYKNMIL